MFFFENVLTRFGSFSHVPVNFALKSNIMDVGLQGSNPGCPKVIIDE